MSTQTNAFLWKSQKYLINILVWETCHIESSRKHAYIILIPLNPTFIQQNKGLKGYTLFFLFLFKNIDFGYSLEPPRPGSSNKYPQYMFWAEIWKNIRVFYLKIFSVWRWNFLYVWIDVFLYARLKNGTYYVTGYGVRLSVRPYTFLFPANSSYSLHPIKLKLGI